MSKFKKDELKYVAKSVLGVLFSDEIYASASQLAYSLILAFIPLLMFLITLAGRMNLPVEEIFDYLRFILPTQAFTLVSGVINEITGSTPFTVFTLVPTIYFISIGTRGVMRVTKNAYHTTQERSVIRSWILSFLFAILLVVVLILALVLLVFGDLIMSKLLTFLRIENLSIFNYLRYLAAYGIMGLVFCAIYAAAPNVRLKFRDVRLGAYLAALLWTAACLLFAFYVNNFSNYGVLFGSLGGLFILLVWLYWTSLMLMLGVYVNSAVYYFRRGYR